MFSPRTCIHHKRLTATGCSANKRVSTSFCSWSRSVRNSALTRWNASDSVASCALLRTRIFIWVENGETLRLTQNGKTITCTVDHSALLVVSRLPLYSSSILSSTSRSTDQSNYFRKIGTIIRSSNNSKWQACMRETDADRSWQAGHGEPWTSKRDEQGRFNASHSCLVTAFHSNLEDLETRVLAHSSEREKSDSEENRKHSIHTHFSKNQKRSILRSEKYGVLTTAEHKALNEGWWISEQSPIRCRGTSSRHSMASV